MKADAVTRLTKVLEAHDIKALYEFSLNFAGEYRAIIAAQMRQAYEFAKNGAADELKVPAPSTNRDTTALINQSAQAVVDKQFSDLLFIIKSEVLKELQKNTLSEVNLGLSDILGAIGDAINSFCDSKLSLTGAIVVSQAVNRGR